MAAIAVMSFISFFFLSFFSNSPSPPFNVITKHMSSVTVQSQPENADKQVEIFCGI